MDGRDMPADKTAEAELAAGALDPADERVLAMLARASDEFDPVPAGLVDRVQFALALDEVYDEVARLQRMTEPADLVGARSAEAAEQVCRITFTADAATVMVTLTPSGPGQVRVDGWLAAAGDLPAAGWSVRIRADGRNWQADVDADGRFSVDAVPRGLAQLVFAPPAQADRHAVITPTFEL